MISSKHFQIYVLCRQGHIFCNLGTVQVFKMALDAKSFYVTEVHLKMVSIIYVRILHPVATCCE